MNLTSMIPVLIRNALGKQKASDALKRNAQDILNIAKDLPNGHPAYQELMGSRDHILIMSERMLFDIDHHIALGCRI